PRATDRDDRGHAQRRAHVRALRSVDRDGAERQGGASGGSAGDLVERGRGLRQRGRALRAAADVSSAAARSAPRITVAGSANVDLVARCEPLPRPGETVTDARLERAPGGKGANQAVACARLGARTRFVGRIGADDLVLRSLQREDVDVGGVVRDEGETGVALVLVESSGENLIAVAPGANARLRAEEVDVGEADAVMCQLEIPLQAVRAAAAGARFFCLNAAPARGALRL